MDAGVGASALRHVRRANSGLCLWCRDLKQIMTDLEVHPSSSIFVVADKSRLDVAKVLLLLLRRRRVM